MNKPSQLKGREDAENLLTRARPRLDQILRRYEIPAEDRDDLLQEAMITTLARWNSIKDPEAWLIVTLREKSVTYWRKRRGSLYEAVDTAILELLAEPTVDSTDALKVDLIQTLEELPPRCRKLLKLRYGLGYDIAEVSEAMGYHPSLSFFYKKSNKPMPGKPHSTTSDERLLGVGGNQEKGMMTRFFLAA